MWQIVTFRYTQRSLVHQSYISPVYDICLWLAYLNNSVNITFFTARLIFIMNLQQVTWLLFELFAWAYSINYQYVLEWHGTLLYVKHMWKDLMNRHVRSQLNESAIRDNWCTGTLWNRIITAQCEGMGEVGSARYEPALLPPCLSIRILSYSNCQRSSHSMSRWMFRNSAL